MTGGPFDTHDQTRLTLSLLAAALLTATLLAAALLTTLPARLLILLAGFLLLATLLAALILTALLAGALVLITHWELLLRDYPASGKLLNKAVVPEVPQLRRSSTNGTYQ
jgi:hypothetical protein